MKRANTLIITIATLFLTSCASTAPLSTTKPDFDTAYTVNADITYGKLEAKAEVKRQDDECWEFRFTEPKALSGVIVQLNDDGVTARLGGLSFTAEDGLPFDLVPDIIATSVDSLNDLQAESIQQQETIMTLGTTFGGQPVTITADSTTGHLLTLKSPYHKLFVEFSGQAESEEIATEECGLMELE